MILFEDYSVYEKRTLAVDDSGNSVTYGDLMTVSESFKNVMKDRSLVMQFCSNSIGSLFGYLSFMHNKCVPLLIDMKTDKGLISHLIEVYQPEYLYLPETKTELIEGKEILFSTHGYALVKTEFERTQELYEELALLLTTSGSVGSPKLVRQSYKNIHSNASSICQYLEIDENERPVTTLPMHYTFGLSVINSHVLKGAKILLTDKSIISKDFWAFAEKEKATSIAGVPFTYEMLDRIEIYDMELPYLKTLTQAGGKLSVELHKVFADYAAKNGKKFIVMYGQTEATARMGYLPADKAIEKCGSMGIAIPGGSLILIDVNGNVIEEPDVVGEMVYEGDNVTLGYAEKKSDLSLGDERHGRLETGDMAKRDADGYYYVVGRKKRFLKLFGNRVNLDEIDRLVRSEFGVECASVGTDEKLITYVTDESLVKDVRVFLSKKTGLNASAFAAVYINEIPKNEAGKTLYGKLSSTL